MDELVLQNAAPELSDLPTAALPNSGADVWFGATVDRTM
jgi:hypothetical protein